MVILSAQETLPFFILSLLNGGQLSKRKEFVHLAHWPSLPPLNNPLPNHLLVLTALSFLTNSMMSLFILAISHCIFLIWKPKLTEPPSIPPTPLSLHYPTFLYQPVLK